MPRLTVQRGIAPVSLMFSLGFRLSYWDTEYLNPEEEEEER